MTQFDAVVLSGGGLKGVSHLGVLCYHSEMGNYKYDSVLTFSGASVGAALCSVLACGVEPMEVFRTIYATESFFDTSKNSGSDKPQSAVLDLFKNWGLMSMEPFIDLVKEVIVKRMNEIPTMKGLYDRTGKTLTISVTNVSTCKVEYFSRHTTPNISILDAVRMSCNLPIIFPKIEYRGSLYWDGGLSDNIPISRIKGATNILVSIVTGSDKKATPEDLLSYVYRAVVLPMNILTAYRYRKYIEMDHVTTVVTEANNIQLIGFTVLSATKMDLFLKGYNEAKWTDKREELVVAGWKWNVVVGEWDGWDFEDTDFTR